MSDSDGNITCCLCGELGEISSDNKTCTSYEQNSEHCKKDGAYENCDDNVSITDDIGSAISKELDSMKTSTAFAFLPPESAKSEFRTKSNNKNDIFQFGPARSSNSVRNSIDKIVEDVGKLGVSDDDDKLFQDPPPNKDCPICMLPMPHAPAGSCGVSTTYMQCCGTVFCYGCAIAESQEMEKGNIKGLCSFCRLPIDNTPKGQIKRLKKRIKLKDSAAFYTLGVRYRDGSCGLLRDNRKAFELWKQGAELGSITSHYSLGVAYMRGELGFDVEMDIDKSIHHLELAAIGGHELARYNLGVVEYSSGNVDQAMKHFMIAARAGEEDSLKEIGKGYKAGLVTKDAYAATLRAYQKIRDEMKSEQRTKAELHRR